MKRRVARLYEINFHDEDSIQNELKNILKCSVDIIKETKRTLLAAAYELEDQRRLTNHFLKERKSVRVQPNDLLWGFFSSELTRFNQTKFRSFYVRSVAYEKEKIVLTVMLTYEKNKRWLDLKKQ